jgi:hypothetical protein
MTTEEIVRKLEPWLARHRRPAWRPVVEDGDGPVTGSKFCGTPWIAPNAPWPECGRCNFSSSLSWVTCRKNSAAGSGHLLRLSTTYDQPGLRCKFGIIDLVGEVANRIQPKHPHHGQKDQAGW